MDDLFQALKTPIAGGLKFDVMTTSMPDDDQHFLLYFITGIYFGPDLKGGRPLKSVLQRIAEKLPPYNSDQLAGSHMKMVEVERVYYYVLRKAVKSLIMRIPFLDQFFQGNLPTQGQGHSACYPQFPDLFPPEFHPHSRFKNRYKIIENLSFINDPEVSYLSAEDVERFKRLTGLNDFFLDRDAARLHTSSDHKILHNVEATKNTLNKEMSPIKDAQNLLRTKLVGDPHDAGDNLQPNFVVAPLRSVPPETKSDSNPMEKSGPAMIFLPRKPAEEDWKNIVAATNRGFALTGTAAMGHVGPIIGLMDIGEGEDSYLFRVSLPGVNRDGRDFSCEIEKDGKVVIQGVTTTGERTVNKYSQVFEMLTQNLCPSGQFSLSFQLPGPVDPQRFYGNYGIDGILEGVVMKDLHK